jgi:hypothetical protein
MRARRGANFEFEAPTAWSRFTNLLVRTVGRKETKRWPRMTRITADDERKSEFKVW